MDRASLENLEPPSLESEKVSNRVLSGKLRVITPIYGGGAEPGLSQIDDLVRGSAVRGQLRFWWRCLYGHTFESVEEMAEAEFNIFGGMGKSADELKASTFSVAVEVEGNPKNAKRSVELTTKGRPKPTIKLSGADLTYILFPESTVEGTKEDLEKRSEEQYFCNFAFQLTLRFCTGEVNDQVCHALRAWVTFGGLGARTRRGLGQLVWEEAPTWTPENSKSKNYWMPQSGEAEKWLVELYRDLSPPRRTSTEWTPLLYSSKVFLHGGNKSADGIPGLAALVKLYKNFRQDREAGTETKEKKKKPGRSRWPEPDKIRHLTGKKKFHTPRFNDTPYYPRAQFGLPLGISFNKFDMTKPEGDPKKGGIPRQEIRWSKVGARPPAILGGIKNSRWASPMVFFTLSDGDKLYQGVLFLKSEPPSKNLELASDTFGNSRCAFSKEHEPGDRTYKDVPTKKVMDTFFEHLENSNYRKVFP